MSSSFLYNHYIQTQLAKESRRVPFAATHSGMPLRHGIMMRMVSQPGMVIIA